MSPHSENKINWFDVIEMILMSDLLKRNSEKLVAIRLLKYDTREDGEISFSQKYLAERMRLSRLTIHRVLTLLEKLELIGPRTHNKMGTTTIKINWYGWRVLAKYFKQVGSVTPMLEEMSSGVRPPCNVRVNKEHYTKVLT